jgi:hypothetical protein
MDTWADFLQETVKDCGRPMRENRPRSAGQHCRQQMPVPGNDQMSDCIDPLLNAVQLSGLCPLPSQFLIEIGELP